MQIIGWSLLLTDWMDDVELASVSSDYRSYSSPLRWVSIHSISQCIMGLCR